MLRLKPSHITSSDVVIFLEYKISTSIPLTAQRPEPFRRIRIQKFNPPPISLYLNFQRAQRPRRAFTYTRYRCLEFFPCIIFHFFIPSSPRPWHAGHCNRPTGVSNALSYYPNLRLRGDYARLLGCARVGLYESTRSVYRRCTFVCMIGEGSS